MTTPSLSPNQIELHRDRMSLIHRAIDSAPITWYLKDEVMRRGHVCVVYQAKLAEGRSMFVAPRFDKSFCRGVENQNWGQANTAVASDRESQIASLTQVSI